MFSNGRGYSLLFAEFPRRGLQDVELEEMYPVETSAVLSARHVNKKVNPYGYGRTMTAIEGRYIQSMSQSR